ncbi:MAG: hypothetical protein ACD_15C00112G0010 [uncultured bacterium]|nr:MAG: hypothetical protein ACD_15C00112G0010 [uncultured bacterium]HCU70667.1 hypothetical protein [Candidatus Moranbacteria bacterium]
MHKTLKIQVAAGIIILISVVLGFSFWTMSRDVDTTPIFVKTGKKQAERLCTQEAMQCPDGGYVGRSGPKCEFAQCPTSKENGCVGEGESIGAVHPDVVARKCCAGMAPVIPKGIVGTQGICQKIAK